MMLFSGRFSSGATQGYFDFPQAQRKDTSIAAGQMGQSREVSKERDILAQVEEVALIVAKGRVEKQLKRRKEKNSDWEVREGEVRLGGKQADFNLKEGTWTFCQYVEPRNTLFFPQDPTEVARVTMENAIVRGYMQRWKRAYLSHHRPGQLIRHLKEFSLTRANERELSERFQKAD